MLDSIVSAFGGSLRSENSAQVKCPCHDDRQASLSIDAKDGKLLVHCHAGCDQSDVIAALKQRGLWPSGNGRQVKPAIVATYNYVDAEGQVIFQAVRMYPKKFFQRRPDGRGGWVKNMHGVNRVLYRLPEVIQAEKVFIVEGEKDVDRLHSLGAVATCNVGGAGKWSSSYSDTLRGKNVVILPDNDKPGFDHAETVARSLDGIASSIKVIRLPGLPDKGDVSDWLDRGGDLPGLLVLAEKCPVWTPGGFQDAEGPDVVQAAFDGQQGAAELFRYIFKDKYVFDHASGLWYSFNGSYFQLEKLDTPLRDVDQVQDLFRAALRESSSNVQSLAQNLRDTDDATSKQRIETEIKVAEGQQKAIRSAVKSLNALNFRKAVIEFSAVGPDSLGTDGEQWDLHPWKLPCLNGVIDLKTGKLEAGMFSDYLRAACPHNYRPDAPRTQFENALLDTYAGNAELVSFIQRLMGAALVGENVEHCLPVLEGPGRNAKDTLLELFGHVLGDDLAGAVQSEILLDQGRTRSSGGPSADIMRLRGRRLVWASETNEGRKMDVGKMKLLTGGGSLVGRPPFGKRDICFPQSHTLVLLTNHKPRIPDTDYAAWKRVYLIPHMVAFVDDPQNDLERKRDKDILKKLKVEAEGVLAWLVEGCLSWQREGLNPPDIVRAATLSYRDENDHVGQFVRDCCDLDSDLFETAENLWAAFKEWADDNSLKPMARNVFGEKLGMRFKPGRHGKARARGFHGLKVCK